MTIQLATASRNTMNDALADLVDAGTTDPEGVMDLETTGATILVSIPLNNPAFGASAVGTMVALGVPLSALAVATGIATTMVVRDRDGDEVYRGTVGLAGSGADAIIDTTSVSIGDSVQLTSHSITAPS